jgi:hypothetical protein
VFVIGWEKKAEQNEIEIPKHALVAVDGARCELKVAEKVGCNHEILLEKNHMPQPGIGAHHLAQRPAIMPGWGGDQ